VPFQNKMKILFGLLLFFLSSSVHADDSGMIKADRQAVADAEATGDSSKVLAAKEQLSDDLSLEEDQRRRDLEGVTIPLVPDGQGHFLADVLINNRVHASLIVDTGSPVIMLSSSFIQKLGLDLSQSQQGFVEVLNGKYKAAAVTLDQVKLGDAEAQDVGAAVLLEDSKEINDGLLGLSFLSKFHYTLDQSGQKLVLRKSE